MLVSERLQLLCGRTERSRIETWSDIDLGAKPARYQLHIGGCADPCGEKSTGNRIFLMLNIVDSPQCQTLTTGHEALQMIAYVLAPSRAFSPAQLRPITSNSAFFSLAAAEITSVYRHF